MKPISNRLSEVRIGENDLFPQFRADIQSYGLDFRKQGCGWFPPILNILGHKHEEGLRGQKP